MNEDLRRRVEREKAAHTEQDVLERNRRLRSRFAHIDCYPSKRRLYAVIERHTQDLTGKVVLDYGCGPGGDLVKYLRAGALKVCGMDISESYIGRAKALCAAKGYAPERYDVRVMDAHHLDYAAGTFDYVIGRGILHHLDVRVARHSLHRVLKTGGRMLFAEPLAGNPMLKLFRRLTPRARTKDERPFTGKDLADLFPPSLWLSEVSFSGIVEAPVSMMTSFLAPSNPDNVLLRAADKLEGWFHKRQILPSWNQVVLFNLTKK
jgi:SAM-dependent methyltransferase